MNTAAIADTGIGRIFIRIMAAVMESRLRYKFLGAEKIDIALIEAAVRG